MAIDTETKRRSAQAYPFLVTAFPVSTGSIDEPDRAHAAGFYSGAQPYQYELYLLTHDGRRRQVVFDIYQHAPATGRGVLYEHAAKTANYTVTTGDGFLTGDASGGAFTFTLYAAFANAGRTVYIKKIDSSANAVTIDGDGSETIDGETSIDLTMQHESVLLESDGSNWLIH